jgi:hypothetical protein
MRCLPENPWQLVDLRSPWLCALPGSEYLAGDLVFGGAAVGEASAGPQPPCDTDRVSLLMRRACRLFPHHSDQTVHLTAVALDDGGEFGALGDRHADTLDDDIIDLVTVVVVNQSPVNSEGRCAARADHVG